MKRNIANTKIKKCYRCGQAKESQSQSYCRACKLAYNAEHRNRDAWKKQAHDYQNNKYASDPAYREWVLANRKEYRRANKEKVSAQNKLNRAIANGTLVRGKCQVCGLSNADAHHYDYSKPLDVLWLCRLHHHRLHRRKLDGVDLFQKHI